MDRKAKGAAMYPYGVLSSARSFVSLFVIVSLLVLGSAGGCGKESTNPKLPTPGEDITVDLPGGATMEMVWIEPGTFMMGSPDTESGRGSDEGPQHEVTITKGFWLGKYEITQEQWETVMSTTPWSGQSYVKSNCGDCAAQYGVLVANG